jgi:hypothetical protein
MAVRDIVPVPGASFEETLTSASPDLLRDMIRGFAQRMMDAEVETICGAGYGEVTPDRVNSRNGYRPREWDTRAGTVELAIPKLRHGTYFPGFLEHRRRAERALVTVVATSYLLGVSTRRVEKLAESLGVTKLSKSQVSVMAAELDEMVAGFRNRRLDAAPYTFVWVDAPTQKVREGGRTVNVHALIATGVNANGNREILGIEVTSSEDGAGWLAFLDIVSASLSRLQIVVAVTCVYATGSLLRTRSVDRSRGPGADPGTLVDAKRRCAVRRQSSPSRGGQPTRTLWPPSSSRRPVGKPTRTDMALSAALDIPCQWPVACRILNVQARKGSLVNYPITTEPGISELDQEDGRVLLEERTQKLLGLSLDEFEAAYDAGTLDLDSRAVRHLIMLLPFAR